MGNLMISIFRTLVGGELAVPVNALYAFAISKSDLPFRKLFNWMIVISMYFGGGLIPYYLVCRSLHLTSTDSPELLEAAKYVNSLVREGLMDREILTAKSAQIQEKILSGLTPAATMTWWDMNTFSDTAKETVPDLMCVNPGILYASEEIKETRNREWTNEIFSWSSVIVRKTIDEETLRHFLAALDYLATTDGQILVQAGIEGVPFQWNEDGKYEWLPEFVEKTNNLDWNKNAVYGVGYYAQMVFNIPAIADKQTVSPALQREDNYLSWENRQEVRDKYDAEMDPPKDYYFLPGEVEGQKFAAIKDVRQEFWAKVVAAQSEEEVESLVTEWGKTTKNMGIDEIIAERQAYMDNFVMAE